MQNHRMCIGLRVCTLKFVMGLELIGRVNINDGIWNVISKEHMEKEKKKKQFPIRSISKFNDICII